jgi:SAM-dependent methyltransferase
MTDVWSERAHAYVVSDAHREGDDLELLVVWAVRAVGAWGQSRAGTVPTALDVATGGGHVARRLRDTGIAVVTCDSAAGMHPDVICTAESLPFADSSFDVVACRTAAHHFADVRRAVEEMARVSRDRVLLVDTVHMGPEVEEAEKLRDPSHIRNYTDAEWRAVVTDAGLRVDEVEFFQHTFDYEAWLARTGCEGDEAVRVATLLGDRVRDGRITLDKIAINAVNAG